MANFISWTLHQLILGIWTPGIRSGRSDKHV